MLSRDASSLYWVVPEKHLSYLSHSQLRSIHLLVVTLSYIVTIIVLSPARRKLSGCLGGKWMDAQPSQGRSCGSTENALPSSVLTYLFFLGDSRSRENGFFSFHYFLKSIFHFLIFSLYSIGFKGWRKYR